MATHVAAQQFSPGAGALRRKEITLLASVPLFVEYEAKCMEDEHLSVAGLSREEARRGRADLRKFDAIMKRKGGVPPRDGDEA